MSPEDVKMGETTMAGIDARVILVAHGLIVRPPDVFKGSGEQFTILNNTDSTVKVSFPVLRTTPLAADILPRQTADFTINANPTGIYDYWVELLVTDRTKDFTLRASGASDPHIIIDF